MRGNIFDCPADATFCRQRLESLKNDIKEPVGLKWSRLGVFDKIYKQTEIVGEVLLEKNLSKRQKMYAFEEVRLGEYVRLNPVCVRTGLRYSHGVGNRIKRTNGGRVDWSPLLITPHALERLNQRGGNQRVTPKMLWSETDFDWMCVLCRYVLRYREDDLSSKFWLVPFGKGAFLVNPEKVSNRCDVGGVLKLRPNMRNRHNRLDSEVRYSHALTAVTYISNWDMYPEQEEVVELIREGHYDDAYDLIFA